VRSRALDAVLAKPGADLDAAVPALLDLADPLERSHVAATLAQHRALSPALLSLLLRDPSEAVRQRAFDALSAIRSVDALDTTLPLLDEPNAGVRAAAARALARFAGSNDAPLVERVVAALERHIEDEDLTARDAVQHTLRSLERGR
jgi:HEAT repeat protein